MLPMSVDNVEPYLLSAPPIHRRAAGDRAARGTRAPEEILPAPAQPLFTQMPVDTQRHSLNV